MKFYFYTTLTVTKYSEAFDKALIDLVANYRKIQKN